MEPNAHQYIISFQCPNCGDIFEKLLQKGVQASGQGGACPNCGIQDGMPGTGAFHVIKKHPDQNVINAIPYNIPRPV
jgi:predicted RNA-binding Zn-ribbon protein involved in translation (DUF1610 family)